MKLNFLFIFLSISISTFSQEKINIHKEVQNERVIRELIKKNKVKTQYKYKISNHYNDTTLIQKIIYDSLGRKIEITRTDINTYHKFFYDKTSRLTKKLHYNSSNQLSKFNIITYGKSRWVTDTLYNGDSTISRYFVRHFNNNALIDTIIWNKNHQCHIVQLIKYNEEYFEIENIFPNSFMIKTKYKNGLKSYTENYSFEKKSKSYYLKSREEHIYNESNLLIQSKIYDVLQNTLLHSIIYQYDFF